MQHLRDFFSVQLDQSDLTIGSFDGVHRGHQTLIKALVENAHQENRPSVVLTFYPHPSVFLRGRTPALYINTPEEKAELLGKLGVDYVITQEFNRSLAEIPAGIFLDRLRSRLGLRSLWVGEDFALGYKREGNRHFLAAAGLEYGFSLHVIPPEIFGGEIVSSTRVREALRSGAVARTAEYLGRSFVVPGKVVSGSSRGRALGIPTANLEIWEERAYPCSGVYACWAEFEGQRHKAVTNIGIRPTFEDKPEQVIVEAHLLDFNADLYGKELRLEFIARLRDERRFSNAELLLARIARDIQRARVILDQDEEGQGA
ncbi:MAG: bifunctional riboflavin kinase/FAD synthetase [Anaerolineales bacterium]